MTTTDGVQLAQIVADQFKIADHEGDRSIRDLLNAVAVAVYMTDAEGRITFYNAAAAELWGCHPEIGESEFCGSWKLFLPDGTPLPHDQCPMAVAIRERRTIRNAEAIAERPDGTRVPFMPFPTPLYDRFGNFVGAVNILVDITEGKRSDAALSQKAAEQSALYRFTDRLYRSRSATVAYRAALDAIIDALGCKRASVLLFDEAGTMRFVSWRNLSKKYRQAVEGHSPWRPGDQDAEPICIPNIDAASELASLRSVLKAEHIQAVAFIPLAVDGIVVGKFMAYYDKPHIFNDHETSVAVTIARQLGFYIARSRADEGRRRSEQESRLLAAVVNSSDDAILTKNLDGIITSWNNGAQRIFGYLPEEIVGKPVTILIPHDRQSEEPIILDRIRKGERIEHYETVRQRKDGSLIDISLTVSPVKDANGRIIGASKIARDITEKRRAEDQQQMLLREMSHRIKNLFALAGGVVSLSARSAQTPGELAAAVQDRLAALARAHTLALSRSPADGDDQLPATMLQSLITAILAPYERHARITIAGADSKVNGSAITSLALLFNEFATNAAKYGSLSVPDGMVDILCSESQDQMQIIWTESGGPPVQNPADAQGFGSLLADITVKRQLAGTYSRQWNPEGLVIDIVVALDRLA